MGPARGWGGPRSIGPGGLFWTRRRAGVGFRRVVPDTHDYFLRRPKAGRHSSKSGQDMIISCGDLSLSSKSGQESRSDWWPWCSKGCTRTLTIYGVARGLVVALRLDGVLIPKVAPDLLPWPVGVLVVAPMGWCSKSWGGVPKSCPRPPTLYTTCLIFLGPF